MVLGNCLALYFWRSLKCLNYLEVMHWWPHALATPQGYSSQTKTEFEFNNIPICDIPCSTIYVVFIGLFRGSVVDPMMAEIPGPSVVFFFFILFSRVCTRSLGSALTLKVHPSIANKTEWGLVAAHWLTSPACARRKCPQLLSPASSLTACLFEFWRPLYGLLFLGGASLNPSWLGSAWCFWTSATTCKGRSVKSKIPLCKPALTYVFLFFSFWGLLGGPAEQAGNTFVFPAISHDFKTTLVVERMLFIIFF